MKKEVRDKWVAALRSGKYIQGQEHLYTSDPERFCCLGVLRCVMAPFDNKQSPDGEELLSEEQLKEFGLTSTDQDTLWKMNDGVDEDRRKSHEYSFHEIAQWIEDNIPLT